MRFPREDARPRQPVMTPGHLIENKSKYTKTCCCGAALMVAQVNDPENHSLNWRTFEALPLEHQSGQRFYRKHDCPEWQRLRDKR